MEINNISGTFKVIDNTIYIKLKIPAKQHKKEPYCDVIDDLKANSFSYNFKSHLWSAPYTDERLKLARCICMYNNYPELQEWYEEIKPELDSDPIYSGPAEYYLEH